MSKTLYISDLQGYYYTAQVDAGPLFELGYHDVDDYADSNDITVIHNLDSGEVVS